VARQGKKVKAAVAGRRSRRSRPSARFAHPRSAWRARNERKETLRQQAAWREDECTARGKTGAGAPTAAMLAREDAEGLTIGGARSACALGTNCIHGRSPSTEGYGPTSDAISRGRRRGEKRIDLRDARGREPELCRSRRRPAGLRAMSSCITGHAKTAYESGCPPAVAAIQRRRYFTTSLAEIATGGR